MELDKLSEVLEGQRKLLVDVQRYASESGAQFVKIGDQVTGVDNAIAALGARVDKLEASRKAHATVVLPGIGDEVEKNGPVSIIDVLFNPESRSRQIVNEYARAKRGLPGGAESRDMTASTDSKGGFLIPQVILPGYVEKARARSVVWQGAGITVYPDLSGEPVEIPVETGVTTVSGLAENEAPTVSDVNIGQITFAPKRIGGLVKASERLFRLGPLAETIIMNNLTRTFGLEMDRIILRGSGSAKESLGIANQGGINEVEIATDGGNFTLAVAENMQIAIEEQNTFVGALKYVGHPRAKHTMKAERIAQFSGDTGGAYVMLPMSDEVLRAQLGYDFLSTTTIPKNLAKGSGTNLTEVYFGNWEDALLALWQDLIFKVSTETGDASGSAFTQNQLWILGQMEYDTNVARPESFCLVNDAKTT